ncbi:MAG: gamma-glutamylputrescine oxidase, partial [Halieaceae bacterium]
MKEEMPHYPDSHHASAAKLLPEYPCLRGQQRFSVCVIGAGYTGISAALHLSQMGHSVALVESERVGWGASGRNGGQLGYGMSDLLPDLIQKCGEENARKFWDISVESVNLFHELSNNYNIDSDFKSGNMACATSARDYDSLRSHADIVDGYGQQIYQQLDRPATLDMSGSPSYHGAILSRHAGHINPLKYALGLAGAADSAGVSIFENSTVTSIDMSQPVTVNTTNGSVIADYAVLACNGHIGKLNTSLAARILPIDNYQAATEVLDGDVIDTLIKGGTCIWDTSKSVHYFRLTPDNRLVMGCGIGIPDHPPRNLERECRKHIAMVYPQLKGVKLDYIWGGTLGGTRNHLPDMGRLAPNVLYSQGYTGHGVGMAPLAGKYIARAIDGESREFELLSQVTHKK